MLAKTTGLAVGPVSHHLRVLERSGLVQSAPELARDTRESWRSASSRSSRWSARTFAHGTTGDQLAQLATSTNLAYLIDAIHR